MPIWRLNSSVAIVRKYIRAINTRDLGAAEQLMCADIDITDSAGITISGRADCLEALRSLAKHSPEYRIDISTMSRRGEYVLVSGHSHSHDPRLARATQWRVRLCDAKITEWQGFAAYPQHSEFDPPNAGTDQLTISPIQALAIAQR